MKKVLFCLLALVVSTGCAVFGEQVNLDNAKREVRKLLEAETEIELSVRTCKPEKRITRLMTEIDRWGQRLLNPQNESVAAPEMIEYGEYCVTVLSALRERRVYAYMLWAEGRLEAASMGRYRDLGDLSQRDLRFLYQYLSEIDVNVICENMLNREIMNRLAEIYNCLDKENRRAVRIMGIQMQRDPYSRSNAPKRKSLDDF